MRSLDLLACRQDQDRYAVAEQAQAATDLQAVDARQADVEHDRVRDVLHDHLDRLLAVLGGLYLIAAEGQRAAQRFAHRPVVLYHQNPHESRF